MDVWLGLLGAVLQLDDNGRYSCSFPNTGERLLGIGKNTNAQTGHNSFVLRGGQSLGYLLLATGVVSAYFYFTPGARNYIDYHCER